MCYLDIAKGQFDNSMFHYERFNDRKTINFLILGEIVQHMTVSQRANRIRGFCSDIGTFPTLSAAFVHRSIRVVSTGRPTS